MELAGFADLRNCSLVFVKNSGNWNILTSNVYV